MEEKGCKVVHATGDADLLIVQTTISSADRADSILIGDDTDLLVLLCYHVGNTRFNVFFKPEIKSNTRKTNRCWNIKSTQSHLGIEVCKNILFIHAILGCDTTSRVFGVGKRTSLARAKVSLFFRKQAEVFRNEDSSVDSILKAGEKALVSLYGGEPTETLNTLRHRRFCEKTATGRSYVQSQKYSSNFIS